MDRELGIYKRIIVPILSVLLIVCVGVLLFVWMWYGPGYYGGYWWYDGGVYFSGDETLEVKPGPDITKQDAGKFCDSIFVLKSQQKCEIAGNPPPAACAVIAEKGLVKALKTYGSQEVAANIAVNPEETLFRADALSGMFTRLAILKLASDGKIALTDPISKHFEVRNCYSKSNYNEVRFAPVKMTYTTERKALKKLEERFPNVALSLKDSDSPVYIADKELDKMVVDDKGNLWYDPDGLLKGAKEVITEELILEFKKNNPNSKLYKTDSNLAWDWGEEWHNGNLKQSTLDKLTMANNSGEITILNLMLNTSGIDFESSYTSATSKDRVLTLEEFIRSHPPRVVRQPGVFCVDNVYDAVLLGRIIEIVSGKPFEKYMQDEIFAPLGMTKTTYSQHENGTPNLAKPRNWVKKPKDEVGYYEEIPQYFTNIAPANGLRTTAGDMSRFMSYLSGMFAHQNSAFIEISPEGELIDIQDKAKTLGAMGVPDSAINLIKPEHFALIGTGLFDSIASSSTSKTPFFYKYEREHKGGTYFTCVLDLFQNGYGMSFVLIPDQSICIFGACAGGGMWQFESEFYAKFFPQKIDTECKENPKVKIPKPERYKGEWSSFVQMNTPAKAEQLADYQTRTYVENDYLKCYGREYVMHDELTFIGRYDANDRIKFIEDSSGNIAYIGNFNPKEKVPFIGSNNFNIGFMLFGLFVILTGLFGFLIGAFLRKSKGEKSTLIEWLARVNVAVNTGLAGVLGIGIVLAMMFVRLEDYGFGMQWWANLWLVLALVASLLALSMAYFTFIIWKNKLWTLSSRIHYTIITVFFLFAPFWLWWWNLLGFTY